MPKYRVTIREVVAHHIEVEASSESDAQSMAYEQYADYPENHIGVEGVISHQPESEGTQEYAYEISEIVETS
jgi:uncharacterized protein affecting Mg2+/Co2+ transport